jgi:hypothetical protein
MYLLACQGKKENAKVRLVRDLPKASSIRSSSGHWQELYRRGARAQKACRDGYSVFSTRTAALFRDLDLARAGGSLRSLLGRLARIDVLVIDDWAMAPFTETERRDFREICEDRYETRSMTPTSQLPVSKWHELIGDPTLADGILDRTVHNAHRIERCAGTRCARPALNRSPKSKRSGVSPLLSGARDCRPLPAPCPAPHSR